jgi:hypothetical protein
MGDVIMKRVVGSLVLVLTAAGFSTAAVNVDVNTPNASVHVGTPQPAPRVTVIERERVVEKEHYEGKKDNGKHKGQKKNKKHKKDHHEDKGEHNRPHDGR